MKYLSLVLLLSLLLACSSGREFKRNPINDIMREYDSNKSYSIILYDLNVEGSFSKSYLHQYKIVVSDGEEVKESLSEWLKVPESYFWANENNVGMELVSKSEDGKISKIPSPAGYNNYVGNQKYGEWRQSGGSSFWHFYGQYAFMGAMFNLASPINRGAYGNYRNNYRNSRPYYGSGSNRTYGTYGQNTTKSRPNFKSRMSNIKSKTGSFRDRVKRRINRSSTRYKSGSSFRSRGRGFGK